MERFDLIYFEQPVEGIARLAEVCPRDRRAGHGR